MYIDNVASYWCREKEVTCTFTEVVAAKVASQPIIPHCFFVRIRHDDVTNETQLQLLSGKLQHGEKEKQLVTYSTLKIHGKYSKKSPLILLIFILKSFFSLMRTYNGMPATRDDHMYKWDMVTYMNKPHPNSWNIVNLLTCRPDNSCFDIVEL